MLSSPSALLSKTLSFLTYLLRGFAELMRPYEDDISKAVIALMTACPGEAVSTRKELLVATRHILATDFRKGFYQHVDTLLDEKARLAKLTLTLTRTRTLTRTLTLSLTLTLTRTLTLDTTRCWLAADANHLKCSVRWRTRH